METTDILLISVLALTLLLSVFFALAEASLLRVSKFRARELAQSGDGRAKRLARLLARLAEVLNLILLLALLSQIGAATVTGLLAQRWFGNVGVSVASGILTLVLFVYGEAIPKTYAVRHAERAALLVSRPISALDRALGPVVRALVWLADIQMPGKGITTSPTVTEGELRLLADEARQEGEITEHDRELIERAFRFGDRRVDEIMVPRPDIVAVEVETPLDEVVEIALRHGHRRLPVYSGSLENVVGIVRLRDLIAAQRGGVEDLSQIVTRILAVPESRRVTSLLHEMQERNDHLALVVDEYGVTAGLVTVEDVAEELLGTISSDQAPHRIEKEGHDRWVVSGSLPVEDLETIGMAIPDGDWNTVAGLMLGLSGRLLDPGDRVRIGSFDLVVEELVGRRIIRVGISYEDET